MSSSATATARAKNAAAPAPAAPRQPKVVKKAPAKKPPVQVAVAAKPKAAVAMKRDPAAGLLAKVHQDLAKSGHKIHSKGSPVLNSPVELHDGLWATRKNSSGNLHARGSERLGALQSVSDDTPGAILATISLNPAAIGTRLPLQAAQYSKYKFTKFRIIFIAELSAANSVANGSLIMGALYDPSAPLPTQDEEGVNTIYSWSDKCPHQVYCSAKLDLDLQLHSQDPLFIRQVPGEAARWTEQARIVYMQACAFNPGAPSIQLGQWYVDYEVELSQASAETGFSDVQSVGTTWFADDGTLAGTTASSFNVNNWSKFRGNSSFLSRINHPLYGWIFVIAPGMYEVAIAGLLTDSSIIESSLNGQGDLFNVAEGSVTQSTTLGHNFATTEAVFTNAAWQITFPGGNLPVTYGKIGATGDPFAYSVKMYWNVKTTSLIRIYPFQLSAGSYLAAGLVTWRAAVTLSRLASAGDAWIDQELDDPLGNARNDSVAQLSIVRGAREAASLVALRAAVSAVLLAKPNSASPTIAYTLDQGLDLKLQLKAPPKASTATMGTGIGILDDILHWLTVEVGEKVGHKAIEDGCRSIKRWLKG